MQVRNKRVLCVVLFAAWISIHCPPTRCAEYSCGDTLPHINVTETSPVGTEILRLRLERGHSVELVFVDSDPVFQPVYQHAFAFDRRDGGNPVKCKHETTTAATQTARGSLCRIISAVSLDADVVRNGTQYSSAKFFNRTSIFLRFKLKCVFPPSTFPCNLFLFILLLNEFPPRFQPDSVSITVDPLNLTRSYPLRDMTGLATDADVGKDGEITYRAGNHSDLIFVTRSGRPRVLLDRKVTFRDLDTTADNGSQQLFLLLVAQDRGQPPRTGNFTLIVNTRGFADSDDNDNNSTDDDDTGSSARSSTGRSNLLMWVLVVPAVLVVIVGIFLLMVVFCSRRRQEENGEGRPDSIARKTAADYDATTSGTSWTESLSPPPWMVVAAGQPGNASDDASKGPDLAGAASDIGSGCEFLAPDATTEERGAKPSEEIITGV